jgi:hypothetical protein
VKRRYQRPRARDNDLKKEDDNKAGRPRVRPLIVRLSRKERKDEFEKTLSEHGILTKFTFAGANITEHPHPYLNFTKHVSIRKIFWECRNNYTNEFQGDGRVLDIGLTMGLWSYPEANLIHGIELQSDPYVRVKLHDLAQRTPPRADGNPNDDAWSWSWSDFRSYDVTPFKFFWFIHSLYYIKANDLAKKMKESMEANDFCVTFAVIHDFPRLVGTFDVGATQEAKYSIDPDNFTVTMLTIGNQKAYVHPYNAWMYETSVRTPSGTLAIKRTCIGPYTHFLKIVILTEDEFCGKYEGVKPITKELDCYTYRDETYVHVGGVTTHVNKRLLDKVYSLMVAQQIEEKNILSKVSYYANRRRPESHQKNLHSVIKPVYRMVRERLVSSRMDLYYQENRNARAVNKGNYLLGKFYVRGWWAFFIMLLKIFVLISALSGLVIVTMRLCAYLIPFPQIMTVLATLGFCFVGSLVLPEVRARAIAVLLGVVTYVRSDLTCHNDTLHDEIIRGPYSLSYYQTVGLIFLVLFVLRIILRSDAFKRLFQGTPRFFHHPSVYREVTKLRKTTILCEGGFAKEINGRPVIEEIIHIPPIQTRIDVTKFPQAEGTTIEVLESDDPVKNDKKKGLQQIAMTFKQILPVCYKGNIHDMEAALRTRALAAVPEARLDWKKPGTLPYQIWDRLLVLRPDYLDVITFEEWNSRFPRGKAMTNRRNFEDLQKGEDHEQAYVECFVKREAQLLLSEKDFEPQRPRVISAVDKKTKVSAGPFAYSLSKRMTEEWNTDNYITYAGGMSTDDLNKWINMGDIEWIFAFTDFSKFDLTQREECYNFETKIYNDFGAQHWIPHWKAICQMYRRTTGYFKGAIKYTVLYTRKSGSNFTSPGNSIINAIAWLAGVYYFYFCELHGETPPEYVFYCKKTMATMLIALLGKHLRCILMGDDNLTVLHPLHFSMDRAKKYFRLASTMVEAMGFKQTGGVTRNPLDIDFLNMIPYPTQRGYRFGKKSGRVIAKIGVTLVRNQFWTETQQRALLRANMISFGPTANHVPFLRVVTRLILKEVGKDGQLLTTRECLHRPQGAIYEADDMTWNYFTEATGLTEADEEDFENRLKENIKLYGLKFIMDYPDLMKLSF